MLDSPAVLGNDLSDQGAFAGCVNTVSTSEQVSESFPKTNNM